MIPHPYVRSGSVRNKDYSITAPDFVTFRLPQPIVKGDCYFYDPIPERSRSIDFKRTGFPSLEGATATLIATKIDDCKTTVIEQPCEIIDDSIIRLEIPSEVSSQWPVGIFQFCITLKYPDGSTVCFAHPGSPMEVIARA